MDLADGTSVEDVQRRTDGSLEVPARRTAESRPRRHHLTCVALSRVGESVIDADAPARGYQPGITPTAVSSKAGSVSCGDGARSARLVGASRMVRWWMEAGPVVVPWLMTEGLPAGDVLPIVRCSW